MSSKPRSRAGMDAEAVARLMAAQDDGEASPTGEAALMPHPLITQQVQPEDARVQDDIRSPSGKIDGRKLRRTGREPFATRLQPAAQDRLKIYASTNGLTIADVLEALIETLPTN